MKIAVIGSGGREHAIVKSLALSKQVSHILAIPGSAGIGQEPKCKLISIPASDHVLVLRELKENKVDLVVIGPEQPLAEGLSDQLRVEGFPVFGPSQAAAQLEASKVYSKEFMQEFGVPTARSETVTSFEEVRRHYASFPKPWVLKADGLAAGKGVTLHKSEEDLFARSRELFEYKMLGDAGSKALLEEFQPGYEMSYLILTNGTDFQALPVSRDHKRLLDHDEGPNTGGMGTIAPVEISEKLRQKIDEEIVEPTLVGLQKRNLLYRGVLYIGLMITPDGPRVIEYNVRFGDPETQVLLPLLDGDWADVFLAIANGQVPKLKWNNKSAACIVLAAPGYPDRPQKGVIIEGDLGGKTGDSYFLHAGTSRDSHGRWSTSGGRVLNAVGVGNNLNEALRAAYSQTAKTHWVGMQFRRDIGR